MNNGVWYIPHDGVFVLTSLKNIHQWPSAHRSWLDKYNGGCPILLLEKVLSYPSLMLEKKNVPLFTTNLSKSRINLSCICYLYIILFSTSNSTIILKSLQWTCWAALTRLVSNTGKQAASMDVICWDESFRPFLTWSIFSHQYFVLVSFHGGFKEKPSNNPVARKTLVSACVLREF